MWAFWKHSILELNFCQDKMTALHKIMLATENLNNNICMSYISIYCLGIIHWIIFLIDCFYYKQTAKKTTVFELKKKSMVSISISKCPILLSAPPQKKTNL